MAKVSYRESVTVKCPILANILKDWALSGRKECIRNCGSFLLSRVAGSTDGTVEVSYYRELLGLQMELWKFLVIESCWVYRWNCGRFLLSRVAGSTDGTVVVSYYRELMGLQTELWDNNFSEEPDIDYFKCLHIHDLEAPLLDTTQAQMFSTREELVCPPDHVVTALYDDEWYFASMDYFKCVHLMQPWIVDNTTCEQITSTPSLEDGPSDDFNQWNFECPSLDQGYSVVVGVFTMDIDIRLTCCSLIQAL
ncbi:uncharacterized protein LOC111083433 [Limulus polyphemus]|uniref:Uncharacterized protein LOC111083433 n=1 Tax=Limulus polyphemus TaxID=6850 RepID=A0ABM1RW95_LIMPO|nr:uncharacterized protein LOC111083433 [Limulus polyphemus]